MQSWNFNNFTNLDVLRSSNLLNAIINIITGLTSVSQSLYGVLGKKFEDLNSNSINHPNDFVHRIYAQTVLTTLLGNKYYK